MAVAQGYGKTVTSGSVFAYDTGDTVNSYIGEPTVNLLPSPELNGYPTYGNYWYTYNTNQYCGNNGCGAYWDIPAIASVSNNIVTTVSDHQIRSFDVINPQTTGGGVTAGTNYLAKKISNTQFSLHAYNGSQDGSEGYINPSTNGFKVHDSYWFDQRVSVNASSFPTKWWGAPHLPNSALVKEIIPGGFTGVNGKQTDCIRLHWFRSDATDGMAYGPDAPFTPNQDVTISFWMRAVDLNAVGQSVYVENYTYNTVSPTDRGAYKTIGPIGVWQKYSNTWNSPNSTAITYFFPSAGNMTVDIANIQIEQKSHSTPFVAGTRSSTQGLLPIVGNSTINLSNVSFDSNAQMIFDGTDDYVEFPTINLSGDFTIAQVMNIAGNANGPMPIGGGYYANGSTYQGYMWFRTNNNQIRLAVNGELVVVFSVLDSLWVGKTIYYAVKRQGTTATLYIDGIEVGSGTISTNNFDIRTVGYSYHPAYASQGNIPVTIIYNRALSSSEVQQNYRHYKTRFNLS